MTETTESAGPLFLKLFGWRNSFVFGPLPMLVGPLLYFYIRSFKETISFKKAWPHFVLFVAFFVVIYWWTLYLEEKYPDSVDIPEEAVRSTFSIVLFSVRYGQLIAYYFLARHALKTYQQSIQDEFSNTSKMNMNWIQWLCNGYIFLVLFSIVSFGLMIKFPENFYLLYVINIAICTPYIYLSTYKGITQPTLWQKPAEVPVARTTINEKKVEDIIARITQLMNNEKLYQEPELTLQDLSSKLEFPAHQVSQAINEGMKKNFYDLVNGYRVEEAKRLLQNVKSRNYTILSVGFEAGFNSKTTFNTVFKKFTGLTPTNFRDQAMIT